MSDHVDQLDLAKYLLDCELADRNNEAWFKDVKFGFHPAGAIGDFVWGGDSISATLGFAWETAANGSHIYLRAKLLFVHANGGKPAEERFTCGPGKWTAKFALMRARGLTDKINPGDDGCWCNNRANH